MLETQDQTARSVIARQEKAFVAMKHDWKDKTAKDPEIGGENFARNAEIASRAWNKLATPELKKIAEESGIGNHPEVVRLMLRIGNLLSEDQLVRGGQGPVASTKSKEEIMYGSPLPASAPMK